MEHIIVYLLFQRSQLFRHAGKDLEYRQCSELHLHPQGMTDAEKQQIQKHHTPLYFLRC